MKLLLDTHTLLWFITANTKLSANAQVLIEDPANEKLVSIVSIWEIAIKHSLGRLVLSDKFENLFPEQLVINGFDELPIKNKHFYEFIKLPQHHSDPFDRLLISQAISEKIHIVSADSAFKDYSVNLLW